MFINKYIMSNLNPFSYPLLLKPISVWKPSFIRKIKSHFVQALWSAIIPLYWFVPPFYGLITFALLTVMFYFIAKKWNPLDGKLKEWQVALIGAFSTNWVLLTLLYILLLKIMT